MQTAQANNKRDTGPQNAYTPAKLRKLLAIPVEDAGLLDTDGKLKAP